MYGKRLNPHSTLDVSILQTPTYLHSPRFRGSVSILNSWDGRKPPANRLNVISPILPRDFQMVDRDGLGVPHSDQIRALAERSVFARNILIHSN